MNQKRRQKGQDEDLIGKWNLINSYSAFFGMWSVTCAASIPGSGTQWIVHDLVIYPYLFAGLLFDLNAMPTSLQATLLKALVYLKTLEQALLFNVSEGAKFHTLARHFNETVRDCNVRPQRKASKCKFEGQLDVGLRDRLLAEFIGLISNESFFPRPTLHSSTCKSFVKRQRT